MNCIPSDPLILLSYINTMLRDRRITLDELCDELCIRRKELEEKLLSVGFVYNSETNCFI